MPDHVQHGNTPYDYLKTTQVDDLTQDQINSSIKESFVPQKKQGKQIIEIHKVKEASSTFGSNGVIPSKGAISTVTFTDAAAGADIQPSAGEVWQIDNLFMAAVLNGSSGTPNAITIAITDGTTRLDIHSFAAAPGTTTPIGNPSASSLKLYLTNDLYLNVRGDQGDTSSFYVPYQQVAM